MRRRRRAGILPSMVASHAEPEIETLDPQLIADAAARAPGCSPALAGLAARFERIFRLSSLAAPGLVCFGGGVPLSPGEQESAEVPALSATGIGLTPERAAVSCLGEVADLLSPLERPGDIVAGAASDCAMRDGWLSEATRGAAGAIDCMAASRSIDGTSVLLPADICLRRAASRRAIAPVGALSSGVAAGQDHSSAACRAMLELLERDAAALWWLGGRAARRFPTTGSAAEAAAGALSALRQGQAFRDTSLLDITSDLGVPVVAAVSRPADGGAGFAIGIAARLSLGEAAYAALLEMAQMEIGAGLALLKLRARGPDGLTAGDRRHLERAAADPLKMPSLTGEGQTVDAAEGIADGSALLRHLEAHGVRVYHIDLTRADIGVPVMRAVSPDLQPFSLDALCGRFVAQRCEVVAPPQVSPY